ncbi:hypothetical protein M408DRAFT_12506 [Serendipita vermifera MAFF 305830]|uniref:AAA+ ATPase domain-containing protein n=1 Tax=Serendipita vermifera MAFF 305830 TaxID=933852 RepID=A0A0C3AAC2_SERVB|nr:hypothetical protein M408DRAFT_12506 [Serendipita vermifera MAFF 305830]
MNRYELDGQIRPPPFEGHEMFGYLDGVSQPAVAGFNINPVPGQQIINPGVILVGEPGDTLLPARPAWTKDGSFLVFRQLKQLVPEFNKFLWDKAPVLSGMTQTQSADLLGARMVGRWKSGAPIDLSPLADNPALGADPNQNNNFDFFHAGFNPTSDESHCPFAAHIRKSRPRSDQPSPLNAIMRAGIPYGPELTAAEIQRNTSSSDIRLERGLAFVSYQSRIDLGFQFIQRAWENDPGFPFGKVHNPGHDPISGQNNDELKAKADDAERRYDLATASDLRYYAIPEIQTRIEKAQAEAAAQGVSLADTVTPESIAEVVARWTSIPVTRLMSTEKEKLLRLEKTLSESVVGQPEAVKAVANAIRLSRSGLRNENRPLASFLFCGPSGTGKTLLSKTLAQTLFDSPDAMCRIDGSEYSEKHSISRLIGAPPGYVGYDSGGQLTEYIRRKPYSVILVDELEKASREFVTIFLQVLDDGRLTDGQGRVVDFRNTVIIFTSNVGSAFLAEMGEGPVRPNVRSSVMQAIRATWPPEFLNRIDSIIIYRALSHQDIRKIVDIRLQEVQSRIDSRKMKLEVSDAAKDYLASIGYSGTYGARPLQRAITTEILNPLSVYILGDRVRDGETIRVEFDAPHNRVMIIPNHEGTGTVDDMDMDYDDSDLVVDEMD